MLLLIKPPATGAFFWCTHHTVESCTERGRSLWWQLWMKLEGNTCSLGKLRPRGARPCSKLQKASKAELGRAPGLLTSACLLSTQFLHLDGKADLHPSLPPPPSLTS